MKNKIELLKRILLGVESEEIVSKFISNTLTITEINALSKRDIPKHVDHWVEFKDLGNAFSMIGYQRMTNLENIIQDIIQKNVDGNLIETGVWKGGACMFMKYMLTQLNSNKKVYVADSFQGLPKPNPEKYIKDLGDIHHTYHFLAIEEDQVKQNFKKFNLLDENVIFLKGWFSETLPKLDDKFCLLRLDGDMYESTMDALSNLYDKLSTGGYIIIDDYSFPSCAAAVTDFRSKNKINEPIHWIDNSAVYWKKEY